MKALTDKCTSVVASYDLQILDPQARPFKRLHLILPLVAKP